MLVFDLRGGISWVKSGCRSQKSDIEFDIWPSTATSWCLEGSDEWSYSQVSKYILGKKQLQRKSLTHFFGTDASALAVISI